MHVTGGSALPAHPREHQVSFVELFMTHVLTVLFCHQSLFKICQSYIILGFNNTKVNCNQEHRECVAIAMFSYKHSNFVHSMCVHASVHSRI
jgi:hypothetical protein